MQSVTVHKAILGQAQNLSNIDSNSIHLVVTSPPYPMIEMWDEIMAAQNPEIKQALADGNGQLAFELMHQELDTVWQQLRRILIPGGIVCINIGDATRTINNNFCLYPNHARIISSLNKLGFQNLPNIIWKKSTNAPNKFMGSGMLPAGAYVTLEHEWILIFRKGGKRIFKDDKSKYERQQSAFFWEERNVWFSDVWDFTGIRQKLKADDSRDRTGAYPITLPYRLINMYSVKGDTVLDPFWGTGTTTVAALISQRNSIGVEVDNVFFDLAKEKIRTIKKGEINELVKKRIQAHASFVEKRISEGGTLRHFNNNLNMPVMTSQEKELALTVVKSITEATDEQSFTVEHELFNNKHIHQQSKKQFAE